MDDTRNMHPARLIDRMRISFDMHRCQTLAYSKGMVVTRCKHKGCGSYAFNLHKEEIDQGVLCDVHFWQDRAEKAEHALAEIAKKFDIGLHPVAKHMVQIANNVLRNKP